MGQRCCIVVPIYKEKLNSIEERVLRELLRKLSRFPVCFMAPGNLCLRYYQENFAECKSLSFNMWQANSLSDYNRLMMQPSFYQEFQKYEYILIFQLDGLLLQGSEELEVFLDMGYDYIGAPWPEGGYCYYKRIIRGSGHIPILRKLQGETVCKVGNGGVSLRKVGSMVQFFEEWQSEVETWDKAEDIFISFFGQKRRCELKIAPVEIAEKFSLENDMKDKIEIGATPFAVHKWELYYPELPEKVGMLT